MNVNRSRNQGLSFLSLLLLAPALLAAADREDPERTFPLPAGGRVSLENVNGDVVVEGWDRAEVSVKATRHARSEADLDALEVVVDATADAVRIHTRYPRRGESGSVTYTLRVPAGASLEGIEVVNGDVTVSGVTGAVSIESVNGALEVEGLAGPVNLSTVNGPIDATLSKLSGEPLRIESVNGPVTVRVPAAADATFAVETVTGKIDNDLGLEVDKGQWVGASLHGKVGSGASRVSIETVNGRITIERS